MPSGYYPEDTAPAALAPTIAPEAGKFYATRDGRKVGPIFRWQGAPSPYHWADQQGWCWDEDGHANVISTANDLVSEWGVDEAPTIAPQAGKTYRMRNGETVGPMRFRGDAEDYPWLGYANTGVARLYQTDGRHHANPAWDIIAEITPDADAPTAEGPVRHRTVAEIVPGAYGRVEVNRPWKPDAPNECGINLLDRKGHALGRGNFTATELRAAAAVLIALADGLDEMGGAS
jgi:hypothetical protein